MQISIDSSPSPCLPWGQLLTIPLFQTAKEGVVTGLVAIPGATVSSPVSTPTSVCLPAVFSETSPGIPDPHGVKCHRTCCAERVGDFLGHKPSVLLFCGFRRTRKRWDAAEAAPRIFRIHPECPLEGTVRELTETGGMEPAFCSRPVALNQGPSGGHRGWHSQLEGQFSLAPIGCYHVRTWGQHG